MKKKLVYNFPGPPKSSGHVTTRLHKTHMNSISASVGKGWRSRCSRRSHTRRGWQDLAPPYPPSRRRWICQSLWLIRVSQASPLGSLFRVYTHRIDSVGSVHSRGTWSSVTWYAVLCVKKWMWHPHGRRLYSKSKARNLQNVDTKKLTILKNQISKSFPPAPGTISEIPRQVRKSPFLTKIVLHPDGHRNVTAFFCDFKTMGRFS